jgi:hypothetical protein
VAVTIKTLGGRVDGIVFVWQAIVALEGIA